MLLLIMLHCQNLLKGFLLANYVVIFTRKEMHFIKNIFEVFDYFDYKTADLKQL